MTSKQKLSRKIFYRVYIILVISIVLIGSLLQYVDNNYSLGDEQNQLLENYQPFVHLILSNLNQSNQSSWQEILNNTSVTTHLKINLVRISDFSSNDELIDQLLNGELLELYDENDKLSLYKYIKDSDYVLEIEGIKTHIPTTFNWIPLVFYLLIALVVFLLIKPFTKQLLKLKSAAKKIGNGDFSTRLVMPSNSTLHPIADAFDTMTKEIEKLVMRQRDLTNAVSHELRTPLARLKFAFAELEDNLNDHNKFDIIKGMQEDVIELEILVDEMLCYAEANQIKDFNFENVYLIKMVNELIDSVKAKKIKIITSISDEITNKTQIYIDEHNLFRALSNVLRNAISFAQNECIIQLKLNNQQLILKIMDDGIGIDDSTKENIFFPFYKIKNNNRSKGYGLGLAIAKNIINHHKGEIKITKGKLKGACFEITIPTIILKN